MRKKNYFYIKSPNHLLGEMIKLMKDNNECDITPIIQKAGKENSINLAKYLDILCENKYIRSITPSVYYIYSDGTKSYVTPVKKFAKKAFPYFTHILAYILGLFSSIFPQIWSDYIKPLLDNISK